MARCKVSKAKLKKAIAGSGGLISVIAKRAGYAWATARDYIHADDELKLLVEAEESAIDDVAESTVIEAIKSGDRGAAQWWLARRRAGKFGDKVDVTTKGESIRADGELDAGKIQRLVELLAEAQAAGGATPGVGTDGPAAPGAD